MKIKIEIEDGKTKSNLIIDGEDLHATKQRIDQFLDFAYGAADRGAKERFKPEFVPEWIGEYDIHNLTQKEKLYILVEKEHKGEWVRSQDIKEEYEQVWGDEIKLSSVSTYLARFHEQGQMERKGSRAQREYRLFEGIKV
ncbi:MAG: hypothetical protein ACE5HH_04705 [Candidatus Hydrothermarchaeales archaeon]